MTVGREVGVVLGQAKERDREGERERAKVKQKARQIVKAKKIIASFFPFLKTPRFVKQKKPLVNC